MSIVGYARVSTPDQNPALQQHAVREAGAKRIFTDYESGAKVERSMIIEGTQAGL